MTERTGYITAEELAAVQHLHKRTPYVITGVTHSYYSVARHYGGTKLNGCPYTYLKEHDELVRNDVLALVQRMRRAAAKAAPAGAPGHPSPTDDQPAADARHNPRT